MKKFKIYTNGSGLVAIKQGWSWPGFCFTWIWALTKSLWLPAIVIIIINLICLKIPNATLIFIIAGIVFGKKGNQWWEKSLMKKGYTELTTVQASNPNNAVMLAQQTGSAKINH